MHFRKNKQFTQQPLANVCCSESVMRAENKLHGVRKIFAVFTKEMFENQYGKRAL